LKRSITSLSDSASVAGDFFLRVYDDNEHHYPRASPFRASKARSLATQVALFAAPLKAPGLRAVGVALVIGLGVGVGLGHWTGRGRIAIIRGSQSPSASFATGLLSRTSHAAAARKAVGPNPVAGVARPPAQLRPLSAHSPISTSVPAPAKVAPLAAQVTRANRPGLFTDSARVKPVNIPHPKSAAAIVPAPSARPIELPRAMADAHRELHVPVWRPAPGAPAPARTDTIAQSAPTVVRPASAPVRPPAVQGNVRVAAQPLRRVMPDVSLRSVMIYKDISVQVQVSLDANGRVREVRLLPPAEQVSESVIGSAVTAARQWTFQPATSGGKAVPSQYLITFRFHAQS